MEYVFVMLDIFIKTNVFLFVQLEHLLLMENVSNVLVTVLNVPTLLISVQLVKVDLFLMLLVVVVKQQMNVNLEDIEMLSVNVELFVLLELISLIQLVMMMNVLLDTKSIKSIKHVLKIVMLQDVQYLNSYKEKLVLMFVLLATSQILQIEFVQDVHQDVIVA